MIFINISYLITFFQKNHDFKHISTFQLRRYWLLQNLIHEDK